MTRSIVYKKLQKIFIVAKMQQYCSSMGEYLQRHTRPAAAATHDGAAAAAIVWMLAYIIVIYLISYQIILFSKPASYTNNARKVGNAGGGARPTPPAFLLFPFLRFLCKEWF